MVDYLNLKAQYESIRAELEPAVLGVLASTRYALGPEVEAFEKAFATFQGAEFCAAVNSGTSALQLALLAAGIGAGDEVITVPNTFVATVSAIRYTNAIPVFVDVDPDSYTMDPAAIEKAITPKTKALLPVHLYGQPADMDPIMEIAKRHNLKVIEDAAQAHGSEYKGRRVGSIGDLGCFSFYPGKNLGACGEGGAVTTNGADLDKAVKVMRDWGQTRKHYHDLPGFNYRMDAFQGAVLGVKLRHLEKWTESRRDHARHYGELLADSGLGLPMEKEYSRHVYHIYGIRLEQRDELAAFLQEQGIYTGMHYPIPVHLQKVHADLGFVSGDFPIAERVASQQLSLPMYPEMPAADVEVVAKAIREFLDKA